MGSVEDKILPLQVRLLRAMLTIALLSAQATQKPPFGGYLRRKPKGEACVLASPVRE